MRADETLAAAKAALAQLEARAHLDRQALKAANAEAVECAKAVASLDAETLLADAVRRQREVWKLMDLAAAFDSLSASGQVHKTAEFRRLEPQLDRRLDAIQRNPRFGEPGPWKVFIDAQRNAGLERWDDFIRRLVNDADASFEGAGT